MCPLPLQTASNLTLGKLVRDRATKLLCAALCMALGAAATAAYAYLVGPVLRALFGSQGGAAWFGGPLSVVSAKVLELGSVSLGALVVATAAVKGIAHYGQLMLASSAGQSALHELRCRAYRGLLSLSPVAPEVRARGELGARFGVDLEAVEAGLTAGVVSLVRESLQIAVLALLLFLLDPSLFAVGLVAFPPAAWLIIRLAGRLRQRRAEVHTAFGELAETVDETAASLEVARAFGAQSWLLERFAVSSEGVASRTLRALRVRALGSPLSEVLGAAALALTLWYARGRIDSGTLSAEAFVSFFTALFLLYQPVKGLSAALSAVRAGEAALERLAPLLFASASYAQTTHGDAPPLSFSSLELRELKAGYGDGPDVLRGVNLHVRSGDKLAVMGESGAGKSTLLRVLLGFVPLRGGELLLDGRPVQATPQNLGRLFALVPQEPFLFRGTILENVRLGNPAATDDELRRACELAGVHRFARALPSGLEAAVGRDGARLSVGQRQRVCLARALASGSPVLLLDEVQAPLDPVTEQEINQQLAELGRHRSILAVTHRPSTAATMGAVLCLRDGRLFPQSDS